MCMLIYQTIVGVSNLRRSSTDGCLVWSLKFFHVKVVDLLRSWAAGRTRVCWPCCSFTNHIFVLHRVFNLRVDRQLSREYFMSDAMTLYYCMCRSWQDCCRRRENRSWPSVSVESVTVSAGVWTPFFLRFHNAVKSGRTCIYYGKLFKNDVLRPL
jgi:hypothetical protein